MNKYRAWDKENKEMRDIVSIWLNDDGTVANVVYRENDTVETLFTNFILMQSTGLKDKNGVEIFEGDIVINKEKRVITYGELRYDGIVDYIGFNVFVKWNEQNENQVEYEIIGNIHANPELLEEVE